MRKRNIWLLALVAGLLSGCLQVEDELTVQPDGSGTVRVVTHTSLSGDLANSFSMAEGGAMYPPTSEAEAKQFFPAPAFSVKVEEEFKGEGKTVTVTAAFKDINALLSSPYGRAHQLALRVENGTLTLKALSGAETIARVAETKPEGEMASFPMPGLEEAQKKANEMKFSFRVTLPNSIASANGTRDGKAVTWLTERAKCKDAEEFAAKLGTLWEASCPAEGLKFTPVTPVRLGLVKFAELSTGAAGAAATLPDTNKILAAVRFQPKSLAVTRSVDLSGDGSVSPSMAVLQGVVTVPTEFAPQQWGAAKLLEAVDAKGKDLKPSEDDDDNGALPRMYVDHFGGEDEEGNEDADDAAKGKEGNEQRRNVSFTFKAPEWKVKEIARIKGSVKLQYLGASEVLKLSNAVPASLIMDMSGRMNFSSFGAERGLVSHPRLETLGLSLRVEQALTQSGAMMIGLEAGGDNASLVDVQVFDADGKPWPTSFHKQNAFEDKKSFQVIVGGRPKAPLSLGLIVSGVGASVDAPISAEKVPIINN